MAIFVSTIIPTIGRESLSRAVKSVLDQKFRSAGVEVVVVNDSGEALPEFSWQLAANLQILNTNRRERSVARNAGAAVARGRYLHFLDDDDWLLPNAFDHFWKLVQKTEAGMYYGGYRFIDSNGKIIEECYPDERGNCFIRFMSGEWQPLQASLFDAYVFHAVGGFEALDTLRGGNEDVDLTRRISLQSDIVGVKQLVAAIRIDRSESTTNYVNLQEQSRQSREMILSLPGAFSRLRDSAKARPTHADYWCGRMLWIYLGSVVWNIQERRIFTAISRWVNFFWGCILGVRHWLSLRFWRGAIRPHQANGWLVSKS
jgi:glycosyltransferase involved in cell wall biosynthesis